MTNYRYELLNDKEFELLSRDLLQNQLKVTLQSFKGGKDKGIDARYSGTKDNKIIMQAKHYSNYNNLKAEMKKEILKIEKLNPQPEKYFLFTSLALSVAELDEIFLIGKKYFQSKDSIYFKSIIDNLISAYKNKYIEEKYYKLWINSTNILKRILRNAEHGSSEFYEKKIIKNSSIYVSTKYFNLAFEKLKKNKFLIISGEPGVGKTTLAHNIIYRFLAKKFRLIYIDSYIYEAEKLLSNDPKDRQIIFFDDFLGRYIDNITNPKNTDSKIINFIDRIKSIKNKYFILTSRTVFLNSAKLISEKLNNSGLELSEYELKLSEYNIYDKALILYNHLYYNDSKKIYLEYVKDNKNYRTIVLHQNYNPRVIEFITKKDVFEKNKIKNNYINYILKCLEEPNLIWEHAYKNEIDYEARALVDTIFSFGRHAYDEHLIKKGFFYRLDYFKKIKNISTSYDSYNKAIRILQNSLIISKRDIEKNALKFSLINPSLGDYLISFYNNSSEEKLGLMESCNSMHQLENNFHPIKSGFINLSKEEILFYKNTLIKKYDDLTKNSEYSHSSPEAYLIHVLLNSFEFSDVKKDIYKLLKAMKLQDADVNHLYSILKAISKRNELTVLKYIITNLLIITSEVISTITDIEDIQFLKSIFEKVRIDFKKYIEKNNLEESYKSKIEGLLSNRIESALDDSEFLEQADLFDRDGELDHDYAQSNLEEKLNNLIGDILADIDEDLTYDWNDFATTKELESNVQEAVGNLNTDDDAIVFSNSFGSKYESEENLKERMDDLFT